MIFYFNGDINICSSVAVTGCTSIFKSERPGTLPSNIATFSMWRDVNFCSDAWRWGILHARICQKHIEYPCVCVWHDRRWTWGCLRSSVQACRYVNGVEPCRWGSLMKIHGFSLCRSPWAALLHTELNVCCVCSSLETLHTAGAEHLDSPQHLSHTCMCVRLCVIVWMRLCVQVSKTG